MATKKGKLEAQAKRIASKEDLQKFLIAVGAAIDSMTAKKSTGWSFFDSEDDDENEEDEDGDEN